MQILAISGSLRSQSSSTLLLKAIRVAAQPKGNVVLYEELSTVPAFNPDLPVLAELGPVARFRAALRASEAVVFATPEYAHGIPGSLKNVLDWVVGSGELSEKPVTLANASARGIYAQAALKEVLKTMNARLILEAEITIDFTGKKLTPQDILNDSQYGPSVRTLLEKLREAAK